MSQQVTHKLCEDTEKQVSILFPSPSSAHVEKVPTRTTLRSFLCFLSSDRAEWHRGTPAIMNAVFFTTVCH